MYFSAIYCTVLYCTQYCTVPVTALLSLLDWTLCLGTGGETWLSSSTADSDRVMQEDPDSLHLAAEIYWAATEGVAGLSY